jgi:hypothetical protein
MNKSCKRLLLPLLVFLCAASAGALDFGLAVGQDAKLSNEGAGDALFTYSPVASPWVSGPLGNSFNFYLSGRLAFEYATDFEDASDWRDPLVLPELDRTELVWRASPSLYLSLGRQRYADPAGLAASGLFDGLSAGFSAGGSRFSAGAWYTGLLYRHTANILMTAQDQDNYGKPFALNGDYFASRRVMVSLDWEKAGSGSGSSAPIQSLALGILGQFDLNGADQTLHSQYLSARYGIRFPQGLELQAEGVLGLGEDPQWHIFFATGLDILWALPGAMEDSLSLRFRYSSPAEGERLAAFLPVSSVSQGQVFDPALAGITALRGSYTLRPLAPLSLTGEASYFIRTDTVTFQDNREPGKLKDDGYALGMELYAAAQWAPLPDLALTLGGGAFFPGLGNTFAEGAAIRWKASLALMLSL